MVRRCTNSSDPAYPNYGGRGIRVCDRWLDYNNFVADMGEKPDGLSLEREDNNKGYEPGNCVWATRHKQSRNTRQNRYVIHNGEPTILFDALKAKGMSPATFYWRIYNKNMSYQEAFDTPVRHY